ncbi:MAG: Hpt domain-containing protein [Candidatus Electronema sp. V4]|uniref:Hpt domain-containing protein n=1 Tax=Candidatus Electronema sp. V4 TaxID=3454756 RepID=UPI00405552C9
MDDAAANEIAAEFLSEVEGYLPKMRSCLHTLKQDRSSGGAAEELHRMAHTIKGAAAMVGFDDLSRVGGLLEQVMEQVMAGTQVMDDELRSLFSDAVQRIDAFCTLRSVEAKQEGSELHEKTLAAFQVKGRAPQPPEETAAVVPPPPASADEGSVEESGDSIAGILDQLLSVNGDGDSPAAEEEVFVLNENLEEAVEETKPAVAVAVDPELMDCFNEEAAEHLENIELQLARLKTAVTGETALTEPLRENLHSLRRSVHTLKGAAAVIGIEPVAAWGREFEDFLDWLHDEAPALHPQALAAAAQGQEVLAALAADPARVLTEQQQAVLAQFRAVQAGSPAAPDPEKTAEQPFASEVEDFFADSEASPAAEVLFDDLFAVSPDAEEEAPLFPPAAPADTLFPEAEAAAPPESTGPEAEEEADLFVEEPSAQPEADPFAEFLPAAEAGPPDERADIFPVFDGDALSAVFPPPAEKEDDPAAKFREIMTAQAAPLPPLASLPDSDLFAEEEPDDEASWFAELPEAEELFAAAPAAEDQEEALDPELLACFTEETAEHLENIDQQLNELAAGVDGETALSAPLRENLHSLRRSVHTLKGAAAVIGIKPVAAWGHEFEDFLDWLHDEAPALRPEDIAAVQDGADILAKIADNPACDTAQEQQAAAARFREIMAAATAAPPEPADLPSAAETAAFFAEMPPDDSAAELFEELSSAELPEPDGLFAGPAAADEAIDPELLTCFSEEAAEHLENIDQQLKELAAGVDGETRLSAPLRENLHSLRRSVHTLKGAAAVIGIEPVAAWGHELEDFLDWLHDEAPALRPDDVAAMQEGADLLVRITENPAGDTAEKKAAVTARFRRIMAGETAQPAEVLSRPLPEEAAPAPPVQEETPPAAPAAPAAEQQQGGVRRINTLRVDISRIDQVVGLSGDMVINLSSFESSMSAMSGTLNELGMILQRLKSINHSLEAGYELATIPYLRGAGEAGGGLTEDFDPLEMDRYSELNILIRSLSEAVSDLDSIMAQSALENVAWEKTVERQARVLKDIQNKMIGLRMTPLSVLSARMHRTVREAERSTGHPAQLVLEGESIMMDTRVWDTMADALMHILRNSVAHGGSPERQLTVWIKAERRGGQFSLRIKDDGRGLDYEAIRAKGMKLYPAERIGSMSDEKLAALIFRHGFSSTGAVSSIAGRGVGMDVVRDAVELLNGSIEIFSARGKGLELLIRLPVAVAQLHAVLARLGGQLYAVPMHDITSAARLRPEEFAAAECELDGRRLPLLNPAAIPGFRVGMEGEAPPESELAVLAVQSGSRQAALVCEQIIGQRDIVFKDLGSHLSSVPCIAGVTIMGDGSLVPILQTDDLLKKWAELTAEAAEAEAVLATAEQEKPLQVLVVDDSISVRKVVSNFLLQQGWQPTIARNGIEALERIREEKPDLVLLDVEMPRMNGFEVLQALQSQPEFQHIPVVMLTSRSADKYREKASQLGARGFMTKPFKEDEAIELIRSMTSGAVPAEMNG